MDSMFRYAGHALEAAGITKGLAMRIAARKESGQ